ncbi:hypothetical protein TNCV_1762901 [Trichonephila clavipes]|nr:hypothetical protein TNCV_1762901 [Trichonephila clavipes]
MQDDTPPDSVPYQQFLIFFLSPCNGAQYAAALTAVTFGVISIQSAFKNRYGIEAPTNKRILWWCHQFKNTGCLSKKMQQLRKCLERGSGDGEAEICLKSKKVYESFCL